MAKSQEDMKQNVTVRLNRSTVRAVQILAARQYASISGLLTQQIENLVAASWLTSGPSARHWHYWMKDFISEARCVPLAKNFIIDKTCIDSNVLI
jgi:hypothetical protein